MEIAPVRYVSEWQPGSCCLFSDLPSENPSAFLNCSAERCVNFIFPRHPIELMMQKKTSSFKEAVIRGETSSDIVTAMMELPYKSSSILQNHTKGSPSSLSARKKGLLEEKEEDAMNVESCWDEDDEWEDEAESEESDAEDLAALQTDSDHHHLDQQPIPEEDADDHHFPALQTDNDSSDSESDGF